LALITVPDRFSGEELASSAFSFSYLALFSTYPS